MKSSLRQRVTLLLMTLFGMVYASSALAVGTASGINILNRATVDYRVGAVDQTLIESAPGAGNSNPGVGNGADTEFLVDNVVDLTVVEVGAAHTVVIPGSLLQVTEFTVTNTGNTTQDYDLTPTDLVGGTVFGNLDTINTDLIEVFVDDNGNGLYDDGVDVSIFIDELAADATETVFIVVTIPALAVDGDAANVELTATTHDAGGAGLGALTAETAAPDTPAAVDIVFGDAGNDGLETDQDSYLVVTATLTIVKDSAVISDPINGTGANRLAIPGAIMEYTITISNGGSSDATNVQITDIIDANLTFETGSYNGGADDVEITVGTAPTTYCTGDAADADADGCGLTGATLTIDPGITVGTVAADNPAVIRFRVSIN